MLAINLLSGGGSQRAQSSGRSALVWPGPESFVSVLFAGALYIWRDAARARRLLKASAGKKVVAEELNTQITKEDLELIRQMEPNGPDLSASCNFPGSMHRLSRLCRSMPA